MDEDKESLFFLIILFVVLVTAFCFYNIGSTDGYRSGQTDCLDGKIKYERTGTTVRTQEAGNRIQGNIATTINPDGEGKIAGISAKMDSSRGVVIGNAVTVNVARWIGQRIIQFEGGNGLSNNKAIGQQLSQSRA